MGVEAWLEDWGWQVLGAVSLGTCLKEEMALARHMLCFLLSYVGDEGGVGVGWGGHTDMDTGPEGTSHQQQNKTAHLEV